VTQRAEQTDGGGWFSAGDCSDYAKKSAAKAAQRLLHNIVIKQQSVQSEASSAQLQK